jgi:DNA-binding transcriptional regulator YhcF (GntR family)
MRLWLSRNGEVPIREQLVTQILLGIASGELPGGSRLPSTREIARRYRVHANTVSAAYQQLEQRGWLESRHGSGVYVCRPKPKLGATPTEGESADQLIARLFRNARELGIPLPTLRTRLRDWLAMQPPDRFLLIEPDEGLRAILAHEIRAAVPFPCDTADVAALQSARRRDGALLLALRSKLAHLQQALPDGHDLIELQLRSVPQSLTPWLPAAGKRDLLIGVASHWPEFLKQARTMLVAAGFDGGGLLLRDAGKHGWRDGLRECNAVICDAHTAGAVPKGVRTIVFPLLADLSIAELREIAAELS